MTPLAEGATFACSKCNSAAGKRKRTIRQRTIACRELPLQEREPELYKRLDEMSQTQLERCWQLWGVDGIDGLCVEIGAEAYYEHLPIFVEILKEGKWRTHALHVRTWLRENLARRVRRSGALEDYDATGKRRNGGPKFDMRNGALTAFATRPFVEFEVLSKNGDIISPDEEIEGRIARKVLQTAGGQFEDEDGSRIFSMPADRESRRFLGTRTLAERREAARCAQMVDALKRDRQLFDEVLAKTITDQRGLAGRLGLDQDEPEVVAVISLLWAVGPRMYLNFLDETKRKRIRNAWDRLDRRSKEPQFRRTLRNEARNRRNGSLAAQLPRRVPAQPKLGSRGAYGIPAELALRWHGRIDRAAGLLLPRVKETALDRTNEDGSRPVELGCDLNPQQQALYRSSASKKPHPKAKLYSE